MGSARAVALFLAVVVVSAWGCGDKLTLSTPVVGPGGTEPAPAGVGIGVSAIDIGGRNVVATADVIGATAVQFEWYFERASLPEVVTTTNQARYIYPLPGFKDYMVRVTLADGRRGIASGAVIVE